jgi:hypothetical protein
MMRVIVNGVSFYTTESRVKSGVGSDTTVNSAIRAVYGLLKKKEQGIASRVAVYNHKMQQQYFDVQIDRL